MPDFSVSPELRPIPARAVSDGGGLDDGEIYRNPEVGFIADMTAAADTDPLARQRIIEAMRGMSVIAPAFDGERAALRARIVRTRGFYK